MTLDKDLFASLCEEYGAGYYNGNIGTYNEKRLHLILKHLASQNADDHEVKLGKYVADVFNGKEIFEIQTGSLYPLKKKLDYYLSETEYQITVIKPFIASKRIVRVDRDSGEVIRCKRSPKKAGDAELYSELNWISNYLCNKRISVIALFIEADEYRYSDEKVRYRKSGKYDSELFPRGILDVKEISGRESLEHLLNGCPDIFTAKEFATLHKLKGRPLYAALNILCELSLLKKEKNKNGTYEYSIIKKQ